ncbi:MAG: phosphotransferase, partial [Gammaproteobacteria bacterium]|nr:phosphotransferase [Gammaproteobacteria bacterium]
MPTSIQSVLYQFALDLSNCSVQALGSAGGFSGAQFWRIGTREGDLALRCWPREHPPIEQLRYIHDVLQHAKRRGIDFVPVPLSIPSGETFVRHNGYLWELAPWLPGQANYLEKPNDDKLRAAMSALAKFHNGLAEYPSARVTAVPAVVERLAMLRQLDRNGLEKLSSYVSSKVWPELEQPAGQFLALVPTVVPRLVAQLAKLENLQFAIQPCIRDIWHDHVFFTGNRVTGMIDFGAMRDDFPAVDVARLLGSLVGDDEDNWRIGTEAYGRTRPLSETELSSIRVLDAT